jgi:hypothetical protein
MLVTCQRGGREEDRARERERERERERMVLLHCSDKMMKKHLLFKRGNLFKYCGSI